MKKKQMPHKETFAIIGFVSSIISFPLTQVSNIFAIIFLLAGLVFSVLGLKSKKKGFAIAGLIISGILFLIVLIGLVLFLTDPRLVRIY